MASLTAESGMPGAVSTAAVVRQPVAKPTLRERATQFIHSWAAKSLMVGVVATAIDLTIGMSMNSLFHVDTRPSAMTGSIVGATFTYFANRYFAFKEKNPKLASSMVKFIVVTVLSSVVHGQLVVWLHDTLGWPFAVSKMLADVAIFTFAQLFVFRYIVFPKAKDEQAEKAMPLPRPSMPRFS